jgi:hypothetical protein
MGLFDLFSSPSSSSATTNTYSGQVNPALTGSGIIISPQTEGGSSGSVTGYYAPLELTLSSIQNATPEPASASLSALANVQASGVASGAASGSAATAQDPITSFISSYWIYILLGSIFFLWSESK